MGLGARMWARVRGCGPGCEAVGLGARLTLAELAARGTPAFSARYATTQLLRAHDVLGAEEAHKL